MDCDFKRLKQELCSEGFTKAAELAEAVRWKLVQARYYVKLAKEKDSPSFLAASEGNAVILQNPELTDSLLQCEAHTMCMTQILHSLGDLIGQVVNESLLAREGKRVNKDVFYLGNVIQKLDSAHVSDCTETSGLLRQLRDSKEFKYITAFSNTIKHRSLIASEQSFQYSESEGAKEGLRFNKFRYKQNTYGAIHASELYADYIKTIECYVCEIVDKLIEVMSRPRDALNGAGSGIDDKGESVTTERLERLRVKYRPEPIKVLFVGESRPVSGKFFYAGDSLLYSQTKSVFEKWLKRKFDDSDEFLMYFKESGYYLDDLCFDPVNHLSPNVRALRRRSGVSSLADRISSYAPECVISVMKAIVPHVREAVEQSRIEMDRGFYSLPFPTRKNEEAYRKKLLRLLKTLHDQG